MKKGFVFITIVILILGCCILSGCNVESGDNSKTKLDIQIRCATLVDTDTQNLKDYSYLTFKPGVDDIFIDINYDGKEREFSLTGFRSTNYPRTYQNEQYSKWQIYTGNSDFLVAECTSYKSAEQSYGVQLTNTPGVFRIRDCGKYIFQWSLYPGKVPSLSDLNFADRTVRVHVMVYKSETGSDIATDSAYHKGFYFQHFYADNEGLDEDIDEYRP